MSDSLEFNVDLSNYSGSLEILLDLAKSQKLIWKIYQSPN